MTDVTQALEELRPSYSDFDITSQVWFMSSTPQAGGGFADVRIGTRLRLQLTFWWIVRFIVSIATFRFFTCDAYERVAVKILRVGTTTITPAEKKTLAKDIRRLRQEISVWRRLKHPNVQPLSGLWWPKHELIPAMVSRWEANGNLTSYLPQLSTPSAKVAMLQDILDGLMYLHREQVIHADLKGENVLISPEGKPLLCDFGVAWTRVKISISFTMGRPGQGTPRYMAPELLIEDTPGDTHYTPASDIWAFGCLASLIFAGVPPYSHKSNVATVISSLLKKEFFPRPERMENSHWALILSCCSFAVDGRAKSDFVHKQLQVLQLLERKGLPKQAQTFCDDYRSTLQESNDVAEEEYNKASRDVPSDGLPRLAEARRTKIVKKMKEATDSLINRLQAEEDSLGRLLDATS